MSETVNGEGVAMLSRTAVKRFTFRQLQVIELIARGLSNDEAALLLGISPRTVKAHTDTLRRLLNVPKRRQVPLAFYEATGTEPRIATSDAPSETSPAGATLRVAGL